MGVHVAAVLSVLLQLVWCVRMDGPIVAVFPSFAAKNAGGGGSAAGNCSVHSMKALNHLALDRSTGRLYVGGVNRIVQLDASLSLEACVINGPRKDSPQCHASGCNSPEFETTLMDNVNKVLLLDAESGYVIACGSLFQGACEKYPMANVSGQSQFVPISIAANDEHSSTYAFIGPEHYNQWGRSNVLYVGTTFTNKGEYRYDVPAIASRSLETLDIAENTFSKQSVLRIEVKYRDHFLVKYVYGFNYSDFAYFVIVQKHSHLPGQEEQGYVTRLARVCINDPNYDSYTEVTLQCLVKESGEKERVTYYNLAQDVKIASAGDELAYSLDIKTGDTILAASFSPSRGMTNEPLAQSALCVYSMKEIEAKFNENIHMCFNGSVKTRNMPYISGLILSGDCPSAGVSIRFIPFPIYISAPELVLTPGVLH